MSEKTDNEEKEEKTPKEVVESKTKKTDNEDSNVKRLQTEVAERDNTISELKKAQKEMQAALDKLQGRPENKGFFDELHALLFGEN